MTALVSVENVSQVFGQAKALDSVSLAIQPGSYTVLLGPSGSGKTTLLSILGGFLQPTTGRVLINGADCTLMAPAKRPTATVFQDYALFPHMSVGSNVAFGLRMQGVSKAGRTAKAQEMLRLVGLEHAFEKKPHQLSGGQRQRGALARALVGEPPVLPLEAPRVADLVVVVRRGRIEDEGWAERVSARAPTRFTATFMGESTIVAGRVDAQ